MLTINELKKYAFKRRLKNLELIRKDYLQDVILFILYTQISPEVIFKGGTAIWKLMKGGRFSEDLDLEFNKNGFSGESVLKYLTLWGFKAEIIKEKRTNNAYYVKYNISAKNFGTSEISLELIFKERNDTIIVPFDSPYPDIPNFEVRTLSPEVIAQEKLNAILHRNKARDVYDLFVLLKNYNFTLKCANLSELEKKIEEKRDSWNELTYFVVGKLPSFESVKDLILSKVSKRE
ncbi:MAG: nucleotidyl transferase AbiEii/AbiGii toxin family protein [Candidatus Asgardarchaeia archaeon]